MTIARVAATLVLLSALASCAAYPVLAPSSPKLTTSAAPARPIRVAGYTTVDRRYHPFDGYLRLAADSLAFERRVTASAGTALAPAERVVTVAREQVVSVKVEDRARFPGSAWVGAVVVLFVAAMGIAISFAPGGA